LVSFRPTLCCQLPSQSDPASSLVSDFGLSKHFSFGENHSEAVGTPYTVAPEIIKGSYNEKCDVWAIGVITYLLLSGETPFGGVDGEDLLKVRNNILTAKVLFQPAEVWDNVSSMAKDFVRVTLQKDPANRPTAKQAQLHPWLQTYAKKTEEIEGTKLNPNVVDALVSFKEYSDMHKLLCEVLSFTLLPEQISDLRKEFEKMDDGDGEISLADLKQVLLESAGARSLGGMTEQEIEDIFNALRVRKTETKIRWHEFIAAGLSQCKVDERNLKLAFDRIDSDRKGYITFDNVMDLVGETDAPENKEELKHMWMESIQHVNGNLDRITVDDFLRIMKGQTLGGPGEPSLERRISGARLDAVPEGKMSPQVKRSTADVMRFVGTSDEFYKEHAIPTLHEETSPYTDLEIQPEVSPNMEGEASDDDAERQVFFKLRSSSFEQKRPKYFDEDDEEFEAPATPRPSILLPTRSKKQIETLIEDESKTPLMVNKVLYRAHREMRLAVLEASKRFEEKQKRRELEKIMEERGKSGTLSPSIALVMRRASALPGLESRSAELTRPADDSVTQTVPRTTEEDAVEAACTRSGRPRRNRKKTVSDMSGMMGHKLSTSTS
jgi:Ca2+-binding EF-hand superfamily protein